MRLNNLKEGEPGTSNHLLQRVAYRLIHPPLGDRTPFGKQKTPWRESL